MEPKVFRYFAIRCPAEVVVIRRTLKGLKVVRSQLKGIDNKVILTQVSYVGGKPIGVMKYAEWVTRTGKQIVANKHMQIDRELVTGLIPFLQR